MHRVSDCNEHHHQWVWTQKSLAAWFQVVQTAESLSTVGMHQSLSTLVDTNFKNSTSWVFQGLAWVARLHATALSQSRSTTCSHNNSARITAHRTVLLCSAWRPLEGKFAVWEWTYKKLMTEPCRPDNLSWWPLLLNNNSTTLSTKVACDNLPSILSTSQGLAGPVTHKELSNKQTHKLFRYKFLFNTSKMAFKVQV